MGKDTDSFKEKLIDIFKQPRILLLLLIVILAIFAVNYAPTEKGVVINGVAAGSDAERAGMAFDTKHSLRSLEKILSINGEKVETPANFYTLVEQLAPNSSFKIITDRKEDGYSIVLQPQGNDSNSQALGISVRDAAKSNIRLGIELEGGSRLILKPTAELSKEEFDLLINTLQSRLDVYGASGTKVNSISDAFSNEQFVVVESISSNKNDVYELISRQGEFEAKVGNQTVFTGNDVLRVLNDARHSGLQGCSPSGDGQVCTYGFQIEISSEAGDRFFNVTKNLDVQGGYLSEKISFYLDGKEITSLNIASTFKYQKITNPQLTVSGKTMPTLKQAQEDGQKEMKFLQAILSTQKLPTELEVVQSYSISSSRGRALLSNAMGVGLLALLLVAATVALRYRKFTIFIGIFVALISELIIVLGVAAFMKLSIDLAAIGGLIAAIGTGVDDQIIITDEQFRKKNAAKTSKGRLKKAMVIVLLSYATTMAAMVPLYFAGLKVIQGFAFMIVVGITIGVLLTRPAFAAYIRVLTSSRAQRKEEQKFEEEN